MPSRSANWLAVVAGLVMTEACTTAVHDSSAASSPGDDAGAPDDDGAASSGPDVTDQYPAFSPAAPQVVSAGGSVLSAPRIVPVFFPGETQASTFTDAITKYLASEEWRASTVEYGVGAATAAAPVQSADPFPAGLATSDFALWLASHLDGTHPEWGPTDDATLASSIFVLYPPAGSSLYAPPNLSTPLTPALCGPHPWDLEGWHWQTTPAPGPAPAIVFAIVGACTSGGLALTDRMTATTTHEIVEAATDPHFVTAPAFNGVDDAHAFWMELTGAGEVGDLCGQELTTPPDVGYLVQRTWSNVAARAGHDPCVPAVAPAYFNVTVDAPDGFYDPYAGVTVQGLIIPGGQSRTVDVHLFSDGPTDAWKITAIDPNAAAGGAALLKLTLDRDTGANGDVLHLTIAPLSDADAQTALYQIDSTLHGVTQHWYGEIAVQ
jgi:hypothetical protein